MSNIDANRPKREKTGGRTKGTPNKVTASIRDAAREYTDNALATLVEVMQDKEAPPSARVSAANAILDRGYGKPTTVIGDGDGEPAQLIHKIILEGVRPDGSAG